MTTFAVMLLAGVDWAGGAKGGLTGAVIGGSIGTVIAVAAWLVRKGGGGNSPR